MSAEHLEPDSRVYVNTLRPPVGTSFFAFKDTLVFREVFLGNSRFLGDFVLRVNISVQAYSYASGANPNEEDFAAKGGVIHVILVLDGDMQVTSNLAVRWDFVDLEIAAPDGFRASLHQPATGRLEEDKWTYDINYEEVLPMFKNMGQEAFDFRAKFQDTYQRTKIEEKGSWDTRSCKIHLEPHPKDANIEERTHKLRTLSVFQTSELLDPVAHFNFKFHVRPTGVSDNNDSRYTVNKPLEVSVGFT
ncbi:hypothetical protein CCMSSC00406_0009689 [Pleurotus cornucopiae]|uniref:Uncharacterized protein n=1 Tax=Pleurotus cornucopiae TaxID=5321 RepID=A0ACB7J0N9_PLECO|nr:hypothetical protein CCMSSC00406_0009689 [Pleurotus cornucopiae]